MLNDSAPCRLSENFSWKMITGAVLTPINDWSHLTTARNVYFPYMMMVASQFNQERTVLLFLPPNIPKSIRLKLEPWLTPEALIAVNSVASPAEKNFFKSKHKFSSAPIELIIWQSVICWNLTGHISPPTPRPWKTTQNISLFTVSFYLKAEFCPSPLGQKVKLILTHLLRPAMAALVFRAHSVVWAVRSVNNPIALEPSIGCMWAHHSAVTATFTHTRTHTPSPQPKAISHTLSHTHALSPDKL